MPRDILEIKNFNAGTITTPDMKDVPIETASYSLNLDSVTEDGKLKGVPSDFHISPAVALSLNILEGDNGIPIYIYETDNNEWKKL